MRDARIRRIEVAMKAVRLMRFGPPDVLDLIDVPKATDGNAVVVCLRRPRRPIDCNKEV
jgi:hypothetical protein